MNEFVVVVWMITLLAGFLKLLQVIDYHWKKKFGKLPDPLRVLKPNK